VGHANKSNQAPAGATETISKHARSFPEKQSLFEIGFECWHPVFGAENDARQEIGERVRHDSFAPPGLDAFFTDDARLSPWVTF
jgi:hypothetical protein